MREIKFRAHVKGKGWIQGFNMFNFHSYFNKGLEPHVQRYEQEWKLSEIELVQFTGLKDKNGVEVYEGDLLRYPGDNTSFTAYEVFFHDGDANTDYNIGYSINRCHHQGNIAGSIIPSFKPKTVSQMEVIGNIHQNPELLKN